MDKTAYDRIASRDSFHFWHIGRREIIADQLSRILVKKHDNKLLDIGCGPGGNISALKPFGSVTGIDVSEDALIYTYEAGYDTVVKSDISHMPFADNTFDIISSLDVFEHITDDVRVMKECYRLLKPGGVLVTTVPAHPFLWSANDEYLNHVRRYTMRNFLSKLHIAQFTILKQNHFITFGVPGILYRKLISRIMPTLYSNEAFDKDFSSTANAFFLSTLRLEKKLMRHIRIPFGSSLFVIARKNQN